MIPEPSRVALVTGATGTLGIATCLALAEAGHDVAIHHRGDEGTADALRAQVRARGRRAVSVGADFAVADVDEVCLDLAGRVRRDLGPIDTLVLNAASQELTPWADLDTPTWDRLYAGTLRLTAALLGTLWPRMDPRRSPVIVVVGSIEGIRPAPGHAAYAVFKSAVHHLVAASAQELGSRGIRVVGVAPGLIDRDGLERDWPDGYERWCRTAALRRPVRPEEVAATIAFLAGPGASAITGVTIPIDAGWSSAPGW